MSVENHPNIHAVGFTVDILQAYLDRLRGNAALADKKVQMDAIHDLVVEFVTKVSTALDARFGPVEAEQQASKSSLNSLDFVRTLHNVAPVTTEEFKKRSCNRHDDCDAADAEYSAKHPGEPIPFNIHCHNECCDECFGN